MKKIAAVLHRNVDFNSMFQRESPFVKRTTYWPFMLKEELERQGYQLVPYQKAESYGSMEAFFHIDRLRKDVLKKYPGKCHIYLGFELAVVEPAHRKKAVKRLAADVYDAVLTTHTDVTGERIFPMAYPADITYIRDEDKIPDRLACLFSGNKTGFGKELYSLRRKVIRFAEKNRIKDFAFFGTGWTPPYSRYQSYQGCAEDKYEAALPYKFSFCFENEFGMRGGVTEKIFDAMCMGIVPVYKGADNILEYVPKECFIDYRQFRSVSQCFRFLQKMPDEEYLKYRRAMRTFMTSEEVKERFSAKYMADVMIHVCRNQDIHKKRKLYLLDIYKCIQIAYAAACKCRQILT